MPNNKFQTYKDKSGKYRFRLLAGNTQVILHSEGYDSKVACKNGIDSVKKMEQLNVDLSLISRRMANIISI